MLKSVVVFFRRRSIKRNVQSNRLLRFPDITKSPTITLLIDGGTRKDIKVMESFLKMSINPKAIRFVVLTESLQSDFLQSDYMFFIRKKDFNSFGILRKEKETSLKSFSDDIFINMSDNNENMLNDYLSSYIGSSFKIGHSKVNVKMHDLIMDYGMEMDVVEKLKILYEYLLMLSGNKNEE